MSNIQCEHGIPVEVDCGYCLRDNRIRDNEIQINRMAQTIRDRNARIDELEAELVRSNASQIKDRNHTIRDLRALVDCLNSNRKEALRMLRQGDTHSAEILLLNNYPSV